MNFSIIRNILGKIMVLMSFLMCLPLIVCICYQETYMNYIAFIIPVVLLQVIGGLFNLKKAKEIW